MAVSVLMRHFISSNEVCNTVYALKRIDEQNSICNYATMGPMIPKEMKYNLNYGDVRGERHSTAATRHLHQLQCCKINVKKIAFGNKEHTTDQKMGVLVLLRLS